MSLHNSPLGVMVDIEALASEQPDAAIIQWGACAFNVQTLEVFHEDAVCYDVSWDSNDPRFGSIDADTVRWWMRQKDEAREAVTSTYAIDGGRCCNQFRGWVEAHYKGAAIWSVPGHYDIPRLEALFKRWDVPWPFERWAVRCATSVLKVIGTDEHKPKRRGPQHHAKFDAIYQAERLCNAIRDARGLS